MSQTPNLGIPLTSAADTDMHFSDWRQRIDGETDSDMMKIDQAIGTHTSSNANSEDGAHGIRASGNKIQVLGDDGIWKDVVAEPEEEYALADHTHDEYAPVDHSHSEYALLEHTHSEYAEAGHTHDDYAAKEHEHSEYALSEHSHTEYAEAEHTHSEYASSTHNHDDVYAQKQHSHTEYSGTDHTHTAAEVGADASGAAAAVQAILDAHKSASNPHSITPEMIGAIAAQIGAAGQVLGFTADNVVGAMDIETGGECSVVFGTYVGNGVSVPSSRAVTLGFKPRFVWVGRVNSYRYDPSAPWDVWRYANPSNSGLMWASHLYSDYVFEGQTRQHPYGEYDEDPSYLNTYDQATIGTTLAITNTGFTVADSDFYAAYGTTQLAVYNDINNSGQTYFYLAIK